jgi:hypothetical protein
MARTKIGGFEMNKENRQLFLTEDFFQIFYQDQSIKEPDSVEEFQSMMAQLKPFLRRMRRKVCIFSIGDRREAKMDPTYLDDR